MNRRKFLAMFGMAPVVAKLAPVIETLAPKEYTYTYKFVNACVAPPLSGRLIFLKGRQVGMTNLSETIMMHRGIWKDVEDGRKV